MKKDITYYSQSVISKASNTKPDFSSSRAGNYAYQNIEEENQNLQNQVHILEEKLRFYDREFEIKYTSIERRLHNITQTCAQLTSQKSTLQIQLQSVLQQFSQQTQMYQQLEHKNNDQKQEIIRLNDYVQRQTSEIELITSSLMKQKNIAKQRKLHLKQSKEEYIELKTHFVDFEKDKSNEVQQKNLEIEELQNQNKEYHSHYEELLQNVKNYTIDQSGNVNVDSASINAIVEENNHLKIELQRVAKKLDKTKKVKNQTMYDQQSEDQQLYQLNQWITSNQNELPDLTNFSQTMQKLFQIIQQLKLKIIKLVSKKSQWKNQYQNLAQQQLERSSSLGNTQPDEHLSAQWENKILELEQYYQNKIVHINSQLFLSNQSQESISDRRFKNMVGIKQMLSSYFYVLLDQRSSLKEANFQLAELQNIDTSLEREQATQKRHRYCFHVVIAIIRLRNSIRRPKRSKDFKYRQLSFEPLPLKNIQKFQEFASLQQKVIEVFEYTVKENQEVFYNLLDENRQILDENQQMKQNQQQLNQEIESLNQINRDLEMQIEQGLNHEEVEAIKNMVEQELVKEISGVQQELDQYKSILKENETLRQQDFNQKDNQLTDLESQISLLKYNTNELHQQIDKLQSENEQLRNNQKKVTGYISPKNKHKFEESKNQLIRRPSEQGSDNDAKSGISRGSQLQDSAYERLFNEQEIKVRFIENEFDQLAQLFTRLQTE